MADRKIRVGLIGLGRAGWGIHARTIQKPAVAEKFQVVAVTDPIAARMEEAKQVFGCRTYDSIEALLQDKDVEMAVVSTYNKDHPAHAIAAMKAGKHVLREAHGHQRRRGGRDDPRARRDQAGPHLQPLLPLRLTFLAQTSFARVSWARSCCSRSTAAPSGAGGTGRRSSPSVAARCSITSHAGRSPGPPGDDRRLHRPAGSPTCGAPRCALAMPTIKIVMRSKAGGPMVDVESQCASVRQSTTSSKAPLAASGAMAMRSTGATNPKLLPQREVSAAPTPDRSYNSEHTPQEGIWQRSQDDSDGYEGIYFNMYDAITAGAPVTVAPSCAPRSLSSTRPVARARSSPDGCTDCGNPPNTDDGRRATDPVNPARHDGAQERNSWQTRRSLSAYWAWVVAVSIHARTIRNPAVSEKFQVVAVTDPITARMEEAKEASAAAPMVAWKSWSRQGVGAGGSCHLQPPARRAQHRCHARRQTCLREPMASKLADADRVIQVCNETGRILTYNHNKRPGLPGRPGRPALWRTGEILLIRIASHSSGAGGTGRPSPRAGDEQQRRSRCGRRSTLLSTLGYDVEPDVTCDVRKTPLCAGDADDHVKIVLRAKGAPTIDVEVTNAAAIRQDSWYIMGTQGGLVGGAQELRWRFFNPKLLPQREATAEPTPDRGYNREDVPWQEESWKKGEEKTTGYDMVYLNLYETIRNGAPVAITPESVRKQIAIFEECRRQSPV